MDATRKKLPKTSVDLRNSDRHINWRAAKQLIPCGYFEEKIVETSDEAFMALMGLNYSPIQAQMAIKELPEFTNNAMEK